MKYSNIFEPGFLELYSSGVTTMEDMVDNKYYSDMSPVINTNEECQNVQEGK